MSSITHTPLRNSIDTAVSLTVFPSGPCIHGIAPASPMQASPPAPTADSGWHDMKEQDGSACDEEVSCRGKDPAAASSTECSTRGSSPAWLSPAPCPRASHAQNALGPSVHSPVGGSTVQQQQGCRGCEAFHAINNRDSPQCICRLSCSSSSGSSSGGDEAACVSARTPGAAQSIGELQRRSTVHVLSRNLITHGSKAFSAPRTHVKYFEEKVMDHAAWSRLRKAAWRHRVEPSSTVRLALGFIWQLLYVVLLSVFVCFLNDFFVPGHPLLSRLVHARVPMEVADFVLPLLLAFRTNVAYQRWWEARTLWGDLVNLSRNLSRQIITWFPSPAPPPAPDASIHRRSCARAHHGRQQQHLNQSKDGAETAAAKSAACISASSSRSCSTSSADRSISSGRSSSSATWMTRADAIQPPHVLPAFCVAGSLVERSMGQKHWTDPSGTPCSARGCSPVSKGPPRTYSALPLGREWPMDQQSFSQPSLPSPLLIQPGDVAQARRAGLRHQALMWVAAMPHALRVHLRKGQAAELELSHLLTPRQLALFNGTPNASMVVASSVSGLIHAAGLDAIREESLQSLVSRYMDVAGGCERIFKTPIPSAFTRHTSRFLMLYLTVMPFLLWQAAGWVSPVIACFIAFLLLGCEHIGVAIEEPFRCLPLDALCMTIELNIKDLESSALARESRCACHGTDPWVTH